MEYSNAFIGRTTQPSEAEVAETLGPAGDLWNELISWISHEKGVGKKGIVAKKYGWSLRLKQKSRNIVYLSPGNHCFLVSFVLSDKALSAAKAAGLPQAVANALEEAPRYPEGNGFRLVVHQARQLAAIRKIAAIKMAG